MPKEFDRFEQRALQAVAAQLPASNFNFPAEEVPAFLEWAVQEFGEQLRKELTSGKPPF